MIKRRARIRRQWTADERATAKAMFVGGSSFSEIGKAMFVGGSSFSEIGKAIGRNAESVMWWARRHLAIRKPREAAPPCPRVLINKGDVLRWYTLGWRFIGFEGGQCAFEWQSSGEPRLPAKQLEAA